MTTPQTTPAPTTDSYGFEECDTCRSKLGLPHLCHGCLSNRRHIYYLNAALAAAQERCRELEEQLERICKALGIGSMHGVEVIVVNIENTMRRASCLSEIERKFFSVPVEDEDDDSIYSDCLLRWGEEPEAYAAQFSDALPKIDCVRQRDEKIATLTRELAEYKAAADAEATALNESQADVREQRAKIADLERQVADDLRASGWNVAIHNDYRLDGEAYTFWLFTNGGRCIKGEGRTDAEALAIVRQSIEISSEQSRRATASPPAKPSETAKLVDSSKKATLQMIDLTSWLTEKDAKEIEGYIRTWRECGYCDGGRHLRMQRQETIVQKKLAAKLPPVPDGEGSMSKCPMCIDRDSLDKTKPRYIPCAWCGDSGKTCIVPIEQPATSNLPEGEGWIAWDGIGTQPVADNVAVEVRYRGPFPTAIAPCEVFDWQHGSLTADGDITAYRATLARPRVDAGAGE